MEVILQGDEAARAALRRMAGEMKKPLMLWERCEDAFFDAERRVFDTQGFGRWKPNTDRYEEWKRKHYPGRPLMVATGQYRTSLTSPNEYLYRRAYPKSLFLGSEYRGQGGGPMLSSVAQTRRRSPFPTENPLFVAPFYRALVAFSGDVVSEWGRG